ncbi:MAG: FliH/SctL family protein [Bacillota bacterium]
MSSVIKATGLSYGQPRAVTGPTAGYPRTEAAAPVPCDPAMAERLQQQAVELLRRARDEAERIVSAARQQAEELIDQAVAGSEEIARQAAEAGRAEGYEAGLATGREQGRQEAEALIKAAEALREEIARERTRVIVEAEREIAQLAMAVAARIIRREVETSPELVVQLVADALRRVKSEETVTVRANPRDVVVLQENETEIRAANKEIRQLSLVEDPAVESGGALVETGHGSIDARIESQINKVKDAIIEFLAGDS